ncbi:hypothetical protein HYX16_03275 [Candidatus Woesearchaeota archaeon]|nr:hypothetical protein [Candidatus Woesearchaeota archaeon]
MEKQIYCGKAEGFFDYFTLWDRFRKLRDAGQLDMRNVLGIPYNDEKDIYVINHLYPFGVTFCAHFEGWDEKKRVSEKVSIWLFGNNISIGRVEKIILEEAEKFKQKA